MKYACGLLCVLSIFSSALIYIHGDSFTSFGLIFLSFAYFIGFLANYKTPPLNNKHSMEVIIDGVTYIPKQSAPEPSALPTKEYEIVSYIDPNCQTDIVGGNVITGKWNFTVCQLRDYPIHSVRRLSDNVVFSIGDKFNLFGGKCEYLIDGFIMEGNIMFATQSNYPLNARRVSLPHLIKLPPIPTEPVVEDKPVTKTMSNIDAYQLGLKDGIKFQQQQNNQQ